MLAHEIGHVRNRDILISSVAATLAGAITLIARMGYWASLFGGGGGRDDRDRGGGFVALLMLILAPIAATLIQLAVSRSREYEADASGAQLHRQSLRAGQRAEEAGRLFEARSHAGYAFNGAPVHRGSAAGRGFLQSLLDASPDCEAHRAADGAPAELEP